MELTELKQYLRIEYDEDDNWLQMLMKVGQSYVIDAIDSNATADDFAEKEQFSFAVCLLVSHWFSNRSATAEKALQDIPFGVLPMIQQLRGWYYANH
ncbi:head-tail connector protein [Terribacillus sp. 7520-G]|uniref:head-tail connector protein n=1 Tax=Terribacillus sp. 7520-G TaxID=2025389 RepID=UPI000BA5A3F0|nr:head-tail connector protein [Terribacillus sp. 7520-G]PAD39813.1 hypothetical protein CHH53_04015 [Terribacillus sp. 7520-G]